MKKGFRIFALSIFCIFIYSCNNYEKPIDKIIAFYEEEIIIKENEQIVISIQLTNIRNEDVVYEYDQNIIAVEGGMLTGINPGETILKASYKDNSDIKAIIKVTVLERKVIDLSQEHLTIPKNLQAELPVILTNLTISDLEFSYNNQGIVNIIDNTIYCLKTGEVIVTIYYNNDNRVSKNLHITVLDEHLISFTNDSITILIGDLVEVLVDLKNIDFSDIIVEISSEEFIDCIVTSKMYIVGYHVGEVTITLRSKTYDISSNIRVYIEEKKEIIFKYDLIMKVDSQTELPIELTNINIEDIVFVFVDNAFNINQTSITALKAGDFTIKAIYRNNETISAIINIKVEEYTIDDVEYWINLLSYDPNEIILNQNQINQYNENIINFYSHTKVVNLLNHPTTITGIEVKSFIQYYNNIYSYTIYNQHGSTVNDERSVILENRNLEAVPSTVSVEYGIVTDFLSLRSYPTNYYSNSSTIDRFQETGLNVGEGVIIYHTSLDGNWYFVQAQNYNGWVLKSKVALCTRYEMNNFLSTNNFLLVTADKLVIENSTIRMGQRIPLVGEDENNYIVNYPTRNQNGYLFLKEVLLSKDLDFHKGYLEYTTANVLIQAFKLLGIQYSWGDKNVNGRDCSSTMNAIYACFGFVLPRNTSNQRQINNYSTTVNGVTGSYLKANLKPGSLIYSSGHVLMYIGEDSNGVSYVLHNTSSGIPGCRTQPFSTYSSKIITTLKLY